MLPTGSKLISLGGIVYKNDEKTLLAIADFWKKMTQHPALMYLTGGEVMNCSVSDTRSRSETWVR